MKKGFVYLKVMVLAAGLSLAWCCAEGPGDDDEDQEICCLCACWGHIEDCKEIESDTIKLKDRDDCETACEEDLCTDPCWVDKALIENCD